MSPKPRSEPAAPEAQNRPGRERPAARAAASGSGKAGSLLQAFGDLPVEQQRLALVLLAAIRETAATMRIPEDRAWNIVYRVLQTGVLQERKADPARRALSRALDPLLVDLDPVPRATVAQAQRLAALKADLLRKGAFTTAALTQVKGMTPNATRQWISRARKRYRLFTVTHDGETLIPAFLLDKALEPRPEAHAPIEALRKVGEDGWALWAWFAMPSSWVGGRVPAELLDSDPRRVAEAARQRAASAT